MDTTQVSEIILRMKADALERRRAAAKELRGLLLNDGKPGKGDHARLIELAGVLGLQPEQLPEVLENLQKLERFDRLMAEEADRKADLLSELGVDAMIAYPTNEALLSLSPEVFFQQIVRQALDARAIVEGPNFYFGRGRAGDIASLGRLCGEFGLTLEVVEPIEVGGEIVSSSRVRNLIAEGQVQDAAQLLTRPYRIRGMVTHGAGRGSKIGFPTANVAAIDTLLPGLGVYAGLATVNTVTRPAAINIGPNPTFGEQGVKIEVHLLEFHGPLYGEPIEVDFLSRLREIHHFSSVEELQVQLQRDIAHTRQLAEGPAREAGSAGKP